jgi:hypothetical protein
MAINGQHGAEWLKMASKYGAQLASLAALSHRACGYRWRWLMAAIQWRNNQYRNRKSIMSMKA